MLHSLVKFRVAVMPTGGGYRGDYEQREILRVCETSGHTFNKLCITITNRRAQTFCQFGRTIGAIKCNFESNIRL